ncbi:mediator of RNA polymerase II transcription subunit 31 isoform X2 [Agelaius tricolor]|uniref:mediator of RNA polymerase II transcription subunit 31 isoform X2 n=1 Tax=Agelaius tricolor TaxID=9191 RepID=UPI0039F19D27
MDADDTGNRLRFQLELEFVQCLANPNYLNFLAQRGYFKDKAFVNYLKYLLYWKEPEYAKYLKPCKACWMDGFGLSNQATGEEGRNVHLLLGLDSLFPGLMLQLPTHSVDAEVVSHLGKDIRVKINDPQKYWRL